MIRKFAAGAVLLACAAAGCGGEAGEPGEPGGVVVNGSDQNGGETAVRTTPLEAVGEVRLDAGAAEVVVRRGDRAEVRQEVRIEPGGDPNRPRHVLEGAVLRLPDCGRNCSIRYTVTLPEPVPVTGRLTSGALGVEGMGGVDVSGTSGRAEVRGVSGPVRVRSTSGGVELADVSGPVDVRSTSGELTGSRISSPDVAAELRTGRIELELTAPQQVRAETGTGEIRLQVPGGAYRVEARTGTGSSEIEVPQDPAAQRRLQLAADTGSLRVEAG